MNRKITFTNVGLVKGSRVWRNQETGVEIIKGANFREVGLYYVCVPTGKNDHDKTDGRRLVATRTTLAGAREVAMSHARAWRVMIEQAFSSATMESAERETREASQMDQIDAWWRRHGIHGSTDYAASILAAREIDHAEALDEHSSRYGEGATKGMPRIPAFS